MNDGQVQYSCMPNLEGGIVDDLLVYRFNVEKHMLVVDGQHIKDDARIRSFNTFNADVHNLSDDYSLLYRGQNQQTDFKN